MLKNDITWKEWAGVAVVGVALGGASAAVANAQDSKNAHLAAMVLGGAALYIMGVGIGASRPEEGWIPAGYLPG